MYSCDYGSCETQPVPCSAHGICTNGTCLCNPGYNGNGYYFSYRDCQLYEPTVVGFATTTVVVAAIATLLGCATIATRFLRNSSSSLTKKQASNKNTLKVRRLLLFIYVRVVLSGVVSILLEGRVMDPDVVPQYSVSANDGTQEQPFQSEVVYRSLFPWLVLGNTFYIIEWIVMVLPLQFLDTKRNSNGLGAAAKNRAIVWFATYYRLFDALYFVHFGWLAVVRMVPGGASMCGCWCQSVMEMSVGWACLLPLFFMNAALATLLGMVFKTGENAAEHHLLAMLFGTHHFQYLYGKLANELILKDPKKKSHIHKFRLLHTATMVAAYGAMVTCTLSAFWRPMREQPELFVEITMWLAHMFNVLCLLGIAGKDLPCHRDGSNDSSRGRSGHTNSTGSTGSSGSNGSSGRSKGTTSTGSIGEDSTSEAAAETGKSTEEFTGIVPQLTETQTQEKPVYPVVASM
jgi:hypothetical protein